MLRPIEKHDIKRIDKLERLTNPITFWNDVRKLVKNVQSARALHRWQCLADQRYSELLLEEAKL
jgi:hypothetical protein